MIHDLGFIHNDLHQNEVVLDRLNGHVHPIIIDFGKACRLGNGRCRKVKNLDWYTNHHPWVAPETICGEHKESKASDVYGLGYLMKMVNSKISCGLLGDLVSLCQGKRNSLFIQHLCFGRGNSFLIEYYMCSIISSLFKDERKKERKKERKNLQQVYFAHIEINYNQTRRLQLRQEYNTMVLQIAIMYIKFF